MYMCVCTVVSFIDPTDCFSQTTWVQIDLMFVEVLCLQVREVKAGESGNATLTHTRSIAILEHPVVDLQTFYLSHTRTLTFDLLSVLHYLQLDDSFV